VTDDVPGDGRGDVRCITKGERAMKARIWVLSTCIPQESRPCFPEVFPDEAEALARFDEAMRAEWEHNGPYDDETGEKLPYPDSPEEAVAAIAADNTDGSWGQWELTSHVIEISEEEPDIRVCRTVVARPTLTSART
jgi:hypothetical protein